MSQITIWGTVFNVKEEPVISASIILKDSTNNKILSYCITNDSGKYEINDIEVDQIVNIHINSIAYQKITKEISLPSQKSILHYDFILQDDVVNLQEVTVTADMPVLVKEDTVSYKVSAYIDGTEEVLGDILEKLPAVQVDENGKILYKGKYIDKLLIEGDDILNKNYNIATKNLGASVVDKIQAIENYQENTILSGIKESDENAINILLREDVKAKPYANIDVGYGYENSYKAGTNILGVNNKAKYYLLGNTNNIGINPSSQSYFQETPDFNDIDKSIENLISIDYVLPKIDFEKVNVNNAVAGALNFIYKPNDKFKIRNNIFISKDKMQLNRENCYTILTDAENITIASSQDLVKEPLIGDAQIGMDYTFSNRAMLKYDARLQIGEILSKSERNTPTDNYDELLTNENFFLNQHLNYSQRIGENNAIFANLLYLYNEKPQTYVLRPAIYSDIIPNNPVNSDDYQSVQSSTTTLNDFNFNIEFMGKSSFGNYNLKSGYSFFDEALSSVLHFSNDSVDILAEDDFINDVSSKQENLFINLQNMHDISNFKIYYDFTLHYKTLNYSHINNSAHNNCFYLSPKAGITYKKKLFSAEILYFFDKKYPEITKTYSNYILKDYRKLSRGYPDTALISYHLFMTNLIYSNFYNQFLFYVSFFYIDNDKAMGTNVYIDNDNTISDKFPIPGNKNYSLSAGLNKFLPFIYSTLKANLNYSWFRYHNIINNSQLRENLSFASHYKLFIKTAFDRFINFEIGGEYRYSKFTTFEWHQVTDNSDISFRFRLIYKPGKKIIMSVTNENMFFSVKSNNSEQYDFLDMDIRYICKKNKLSLKLIARNILNNTEFVKTSISDYSIGYESYDLLPRHILLSVSYRL